MSSSLSIFMLNFTALPPQILAKDLVRTRNYITKFIEFRSHLQGVALKLETVRSHEAMASAMKDVTKAMVSLNKQVWMMMPTRMRQCLPCSSSCRSETKGQGLVECIRVTRNIFRCVVPGVCCRSSESLTMLHAGSRLL